LFGYGRLMLDLTLRPGSGIVFTTPPALTGLDRVSGVYALAHHPRGIVAIGEGNDILGRYGERQDWTAYDKEDQRRRAANPNCIELVRVAFEYGLDGWEFYPLVIDPHFGCAMGGCYRRQNLESALHNAMREHPRYTLSNGQRSHKRCKRCNPPLREPKLRRLP